MTVYRASLFGDLTVKVVPIGDEGTLLQINLVDADDMVTVLCHLGDFSCKPGDTVCIQNVMLPANLSATN